MKIASNSLEETGDTQATLVLTLQFLCKEFHLTSDSHTFMIIRIPGWTNYKHEARIRSLLLKLHYMSSFRIGRTNSAQR